MRKLFLIIAIMPFMCQATSLDSCYVWAERHYPIVAQYGLVESTRDYTLQNLNRGWLQQVQFSAQATYQSEGINWPEEFAPLMEALYGRKIDGVAKDHYKLELDLQQRIWDGNESRYARKVADLQADADAAQTTVDIYQLRQRITDLYFGCLLLEQRLQLNQDLQKLLDANHKKESQLIAGGIAMQSDADAILVEKMQAQQQEIELQNALKTYRILLQLFCGCDAELLENLEEPAESTLIIKDLQRPELNAMSKQREILEAKKESLNSMVLPHINAFAQGYYGYPGLNMFENMLNRDWSLNGIVGINVSWNIGGFYTLKNRKAILSNQQAMLQNKEDVFRFNNDLQSQQQLTELTRYNEILDKDAEIVTLRQNIRQAREVQIDSGIVDSTQLLEAVTKENQARQQAVIHRLEWLQKQCNYRIINGL